MNLTKASYKVTTVFILVFSILVSLQAPAFVADPDLLWKVISSQCVPNQKANKDPDPCVEVTLQKDGPQGYAVLKDLTGPYQYLLLPTTKVTGIESPVVLTANSPNYFYQAWEARSHMEKIYGAPIPPEEISLTVNSRYGRSQNQLHIHISCTRQDVKALVQSNLENIAAAWSLFPGGILGHRYYARRITMQQLKEQNAFKLLADDLPKAKSNMYEFGLGVMAVKNLKGEIEFVMLADQVKLLEMDLGHVEEIQDHQCPQL